MREEADGMVMFRCGFCELLVTEEEKVTHRCRFKIPRWTDQDMRQWCLEALRAHVVRIREMRDEALRDIDEMRQKGTSFEKRRDSVHMRKIRWCDEQEQMLIKLGRSFKVRREDTWWTEDAYWYAERIGMKRFIYQEVYNIVEYVPQRDYGEEERGAAGGSD